MYKIEHKWEGDYYNGLLIIGKNKSRDINGNPVYKLFLSDGTTAICKTYELSGYDKYYKSLSGLRNSKLQK